MITGRQIRAARGLLGWDASELAAKAGLTRETVSRIENSTVQAREGSLNHIMQVFAGNGVEFTDNQGVRMKVTGVEIFDGPDQFDNFSAFLCDHLAQHGGDVCVSVVDENLLFKYRKDPLTHRKRLKDLCEKGTIKSFRILANKSEFAPTYATYKRNPGPAMSPTAFYAFGDCLALISFAHNPPPYVVVLQSAPLADAYRQAFEVAWVAAEAPPPPPVKKQ